MTTETKALDYQGRKTRRVDGHARRQAILEATLRIIIRDGIRGVRHRAVAAEAQVPLSATTYYFKDIQDLINDSFLYWVEKAQAETDRLEAESLSVLEGVDVAALERDEEKKRQLAERIGRFVQAHVLGQAAQREDRLLEYSFKVEALRNERLASVVMAPRQALLDAIVGFLHRVGSSAPEAEALQVMGTLMELEYQLLLDRQAGEALLPQAVERLVARLFP